MRRALTGRGISFKITERKPQALAADSAVMMSRPIDWVSTWSKVRRRKEENSPPPLCADVVGNGMLLTLPAPTGVEPTGLLTGVPIFTSYVKFRL